jgi:hypothetical protein
MHPVRLGRLRLPLPFAARVGLVLPAVSVRAAPKPRTKEEQAKVDRAIDRAIAYLKNRR